MIAISLADTCSSERAFSDASKQLQSHDVDGSEPCCPQLRLVMLRVLRILHRAFPLSAPPIQAALFSTYIDFWLQQDRVASHNRWPACETRIVIRSCLRVQLRIATIKHITSIHSRSTLAAGAGGVHVLGTSMLPISTLVSARMCQHPQRRDIGLAASLACTAYTVQSVFSWCCP
jgi:hypothetical protein